MATAKAELPMTKKRKLTIIAVVLVAIVAVPLVAYGILYYVNSTEKFHLGLVPNSSEIERGSYQSVTAVLQYSF
jgi:hypothetical protein